MICEIKRDIGRKSWFFHTPLYSTPPLGESLSEYCYAVWHGKIRMAYLLDGKKNFDDMFICFDTTHERDRWTDKQTPHNDIGRACIASRGKNWKGSEELYQMVIASLLCHTMIVWFAWVLQGSLVARCSNWILFCFTTLP